MKRLRALFKGKENSPHCCDFCDPMQYYHDIVESIIAALEAKDAYTANHSRRVSDMVERLCDGLGLASKESLEIHLAAHVHDIGKIGIPDAILSKSSSLTAEEWTIMKSHPSIGSRILKSSERLHPISKIVLYHHERWDGSGYPEGLDKEHIPLGSRVIALCDSVDAMLSLRPYRTPLSMSQCRKEIINGSGVLYDPALTEYFVHHWEEILNFESQKGGFTICPS